MIIYESTKNGFLQDVQKGVIAAKILQEYQDKIGGSGQGQINSWRNSMNFMGGVMANQAIPGDAQVAIEYRLPYTAKRVDFMVSGISQENQGCQQQPHRLVFVLEPQGQSLQFQLLS